MSVICCKIIQEKGWEIKIGLKLVIIRNWVMGIREYIKPFSLLCTFKIFYDKKFFKNRKIKERLGTVKTILSLSFHLTISFKYSLLRYNIEFCDKRCQRNKATAGTILFNPQ